MTSTSQDGVLVLLKDEYAVLLETSDGSQRLVEGPARLNLSPTEHLEFRRKKVILSPDQYCVIASPYDCETKTNLWGRREVRSGPMTFSLHPGETIDGPASSPQNVIVLGPQDGILVQAMQESDEHNAGEQYAVRGPARFIPNKHEVITAASRPAVVVQKNSGVYVQQATTGDVRLVAGPAVYNLQDEEELWYREMSHRECVALEVDQEAHERSFWAPAITMSEDEVMCVYDRRSTDQPNSCRYICGPLVHLLEPFSSVKILSLAGGVPKQEGVYQAGKIRINQDFCNDSICIRTKDNAELRVLVSYTWQFLVDTAVAAEVSKVFAIVDFVGLMTASMGSTIRTVAAKHDFEAFHRHASDLIRKELFSQTQIECGGEPTTVHGRWFPECRILVSDVDVRSIEPVDPEIAELLNSSIRSNMRILCTKMEDAAQLNAEKEKIMHDCDIAEMRRRVIHVENQNLQAESLERARIEGQALLEQAIADRKAKEIVGMAALQQEMDATAGRIKTLAEQEPVAVHRALQFSRVHELGAYVQALKVVPANIHAVGRLP